MAIPNNYIDKITDKNKNESRLICPAAEHVRVENDNFEADNLDEVLKEIDDTIDDIDNKVVKKVTFNGGNPVTPDKAGNVNIDQAKSDWTERDSNSPKFIEHKPDIVEDVFYEEQTRTFKKNKNGLVQEIMTLPEQGSQVTFDGQMSSTSENGVQNKVIKAYVDAVSQRIDTLIGSGNVQGAIDTFNEVVAFLNGINSSETLAAKLLLKADKATTYTKTETDNAIADAVEGLGGGSVESVSVNGGQPIQPVNGNVNLQGVATEDYVDDAVDDKLTQVVVNEISGAADIITIDDADLAFIDEDGNIAMRVADGHVDTANFDSRQVATNTTAIQQLQSQIGQQGSNVQVDVSVKEDSEAAFDIADESGNVVMRISNKGHIKTKCFDSENTDVFRATKLDSPQCICHAIGAATGTENTIPYFRNGITKGYKFFEVDGYDCQDGVTICYHTLRQFKNKTTGELETITPANITSTELLANYTWDDGTPIATLKEVIWFICYFHRFPLHVDVKSTMTSQSCYDAAEYAESLGVGKYVFFENGKYDLFGNLPQNRLMISTTSNIPSDAASYKKPDNNIIFIYGGSSTTDTDEQLAAFAKAAHDAGCYTEVYTYYNIEHVRRAFRCGIDFIITSGMTNNDV